VNDLHGGDDGSARGEVLQIVRVVHHYLPESDLSVRESVDVRRDLTFLVFESHRHVFRRPVAVAVCAAVLADVAEALPWRARATMLRSCAAHLGWALSADVTAPDPAVDPFGFLRTAASGSSSKGDPHGSSHAHDAGGRPPTRPVHRVPALDRTRARPPGVPSEPPRPRRGQMREEIDPPGPVP
jgi:hypothetical protein